MAQTDTTVIDPGVANFHDRRLLRKAFPRLIHSLCAQTRDLPANDSTVIKFRRYSLLTAATTPLTEGVTPSGSQLSKTDISATLLQYGDYITLTDKLTFSTTDPVLTEANSVLAQQAGNTLDQLTRDVIVAGTTIQYASTAAARTDITAAMVKRMRPGSVLVDIAIDQGGCFETSRPTTHADPTYIVDDVVHYCVTNMPGAVPRTSTYALNNATLPFVLALANKGWKRALAEDEHLRNGLNVARGKITHPEVAAALNASYSPAEEALLA